MSDADRSLFAAESDEAAVERMGRVLDEIAMERRRQERKGLEHRARGQEHWRSCADPLLPTERKLAILVEEVGEVAKALNEEWIGEPANLREELIHVAAVAVAWAESLSTPMCEACGEAGTERVLSPEDGDMWFCEPCHTALMAEGQGV